MNLVRVIKNCLATETKLVQHADSVIGDSKQASMNRHILERFEFLQRGTQETETELRHLQHRQESFVIQYQESLKISNQLQQLASQPNGQTRIDAETKLQKQKQDLDRELSQKAQQLLQMRLKLAERHHETCQLLTALQSMFLDEQLITWKRNQQLAGNGAVFDGSLDTLQQWCENLADLIWQNRQQIKKVELLRQQLPINVPAGCQDLLPILNTTITGLLSSLVTSTFIIEKQPPQVLKKDSRFTATVRLLVGGKLNVHMNPPTVKATIISEEQARMLLKNDKNVKNETSGDILNNMGTMEYHQASGVLSVTFRNMALKRIRRAEKKGNETVTEEKFSILFQSQFSVGGGELVFQVWTLSLPAVVTVHGNQECNALATILWDNAFAEPGRLPFQVPEKVPWPHLAQALMTKFASNCGLGMSTENLAYLAFKLFGQADDYSMHTVSWTQFNREPLHGRNFTFWEWFYSILKLTKDWLQGPWKERLIHGFVSKQQAQEWLMRSQSGTFLLRFSDSELGGITIAWMAEDAKGERQVWNLAPFTDKHFRIRGLGDTIKDLHNLLYLYPDIPKARTFGKFWTQDVPTIQHGGYVPPALTTVIPGVTDRPPAPLMQYTDDPLSPQSSPYESYAVQTPGSVGTDDTMMNNFDQDELMLADLSTDYNPDDIIDHINVNELIYSTCNNFSQ
jgi:signal transducer and activator of transcription 5B